MPRAAKRDSEMLYVKSIERDHFQQGTLDLFWQFMCERQEVLIRRLSGMGRPWTLDPIMDKEFFTNVYRELDPGTTYIINKILKSATLSIEDKLFNVMAFRLMGSSEASHTMLCTIKTTSGTRFKPMSVSRFDKAKFVLKLKKVPFEDTKFFGDAYRVASYNNFGDIKMASASGAVKITNISNLFEYLAEIVPTLVEKLEFAKSPRDAFDRIMEIKGYGEFLAQQVLTDMLYLGELFAEDSDNVLLKHPGSLELMTTDEWVQAGPGAKKGIWELMRTDVKPGNLFIVMKWLRDNQVEEFARLQLPFPYLKNADNEPIMLTVTNLQNCLCEFSKYLNVLSGNVRGLRTFRPESATLESNFSTDDFAFIRQRAGENENYIEYVTVETTTDDYSDALISVVNLEGYRTVSPPGLGATQSLKAGQNAASVPVTPEVPVWERLAAQGMEVGGRGAYTTAGSMSATTTGATAALNPVYVNVSHNGQPQNGQPQPQVVDLWQMRQIIINPERIAGIPYALMIIPVP